jgi:hypothetical protein
MAQVVHSLRTTLTLTRVKEAFQGKSLCTQQSAMSIWQSAFTSLLEPLRQGNYVPYHLHFKTSINEYMLNNRIFAQLSKKKMQSDNIRKQRLKCAIAFML